MNHWQVKILPVQLDDPAASARSEGREKKTAKASAVHSPVVSLIELKGFL